MSDLALSRARTRRKRPPRGWVVFVAIVLFYLAFVAKEALNLLLGDTSLGNTLTLFVDGTLVYCWWPFVLKPDKWPGLDRAVFSSLPRARAYAYNLLT